MKQLLNEVEYLKKKAWIVYRVEARGLGSGETTVGSEAERDKAISNVLSKLIDAASGRFSVNDIVVSNANKGRILAYYREHPGLITAEAVDYKLEQ